MAKKHYDSYANNSEIQHINPVEILIRRTYSKSAPLLLSEAILFTIAGVLILVRPLAFVTVLTVIIGIGLILFGLYRTMAGFVTSHNTGGGWFDVFFGLINLILGILFCVYPGTSLVSIIYIFVILFLLKALRALFFAINMARARYGHYVFMLIMSVILVLLAVALLFWPMAGIMAMVYYLVAVLFVYALSDFYMFIELVRLKRSL